MKTFRILPCSLSLLLSVLAGPAFAQNWRLVWHDEFDGPSIDRSKWENEIGAGKWGNNELEYYTDRAANSFIRDGKLVIQALKEEYKGSQFTSARMRTAGRGDWTYGRIEARARMPKGKGLWPAIWMLPTDWEYGGWAASGEIDIMECIGSQPGTIIGSIHFGGVYPDNEISFGWYDLPAGQDFSSAFHVFAVEWEPREFRWYVDGLKYLVKTNWSSTGAPFPAPFDKRFHLLLNVAVGGDWPGSPDGSTTFPQEMIIDYVRVFQDSDRLPVRRGQIPGDGNADSVLDLSDAIWLVAGLFLGIGGKPPCLGTSLQAGGNLRLLDLNGDGGVDISDPVYLLTFLFLGGNLPVLGMGCVAIPGCPGRCPDACLASGSPELLVFDPPPCGVHDLLRGRICGLDPGAHQIAVYVNVCGLWWGSKPRVGEPLTAIGLDGSWETEFITRDQDEKADRFSVYVVPTGFRPPLALGVERLPGLLEERAVLAIQVHRDCLCP